MNRTQQCLERLKGPIAPIAVCFNDDGTVDFEAVGRYVDWLAAQNVPVRLDLTQNDSVNVIALEVPRKKSATLNPSIGWNIWKNWSAFELGVAVVVTRSELRKPLGASVICCAV